MRVEEAAHGSDLYRQAVELRLAVLRRPLGLDFTPEQLAEEGACVHLVAVDGDSVVGTLLLEPKGGATVQMRQVAVRPDLQGHGVGRLLVEASERAAARRGWPDMTMHARETAVPFYLRLGYRIEGAPFEEVGLPHRFMRKNIAETLDSDPT